ncbi:hypothetical protein CCACVL1_26254 [Corchorus capsularis]|uniref:Uncharacterized protein n=1 Tax=Corchorus capsularis TaxID=210143 RepID=A0A1R3GFG3_COCAP|nr:hypothetical protein CCACVL1_26254 [Corchorus capsularis]
MAEIKKGLWPLAISEKHYIL